MYFFIQGGVFWTEKFNSDVHFCLPKPETLCSPEKDISRIIEGFQFHN